MTNKWKPPLSLQSAGLIKLDTKGWSIGKRVKHQRKFKRFADFFLNWMLHKHHLLFHRDAAVINNKFVPEAGVISPKSRLCWKRRTTTQKQWYNVIAAKKDWKNLIKQSDQRNHQKPITKDNVKKSDRRPSEGMDQPAFWFDLVVYEGGGEAISPLIVLEWMHAFW